LLLAVVAVAEARLVNTAAAVAELAATFTQHRKPSRQLEPALRLRLAQEAVAGSAVLAATTEAAAPSRRSLCPQLAAGVADAEVDLPSPETTVEAAAAQVVFPAIRQAQEPLDKVRTAAQMALKEFHFVAAAAVVAEALALMVDQEPPTVATAPPISASTMRAAAEADAEQFPAEVLAALPLAAMAEMQRRQRVQTQRPLIVVQAVAVRVLRQPAMERAELVQTA
jgi:hypothetical protein